VTSCSLHLVSKDGSRHHRILLPPVARSRISAYDTLGTMEPFTFTVSLLTGGTP
jgi:hypothetical protein